MLDRRRLIALVAPAVLASVLGGAHRRGAKFCFRGALAELRQTVVPFPPGGGTDAIARVVAAKLSDIWGQQVVVENRGGGATNIGTETVVRADADGYTMLLQSMPLAVNRFLFPSLNYDAITDLAPVSLLCEYANIMAVPMSSPANSVADFIANAKICPGRSPSPPPVTAPRCISPASCSSAWPASKCCTCPIAVQDLRSTTCCPGG